MARAQLLLLVHEGSIREGSLHHARLMAHHHQHTPVEHGADGFQHVAQHWFAQNGLQYFGFVGMHAGALARGQNKGGCLQHGGSLQKRWKENSPSARKGQADGCEGEGEGLLKKALPFPLELPFPYPKTFILEDGRRDRGREQTCGRRSPAGRRLSRTKGNAFGKSCLWGSWRYEKGGPEGPPLLCGIIPAGWQAAMPEQFFQAQAFWKTSSPSRTSIWTA